MPTDLQTSFIPKQQAAPLAPLEKRRRPINFLMLIAVFIFIVGVAASGGLFAYKLYLERMNDSIAAQIEALKPDESAINDLKQFNMRVNTGNKLLSAHTTLLPIFSLLENATIENVRFTSFGYAANSDTNSATLHLGGQAKNYEAIALQSDAFGASGAIKNSVFSGLAFDAASKNINFSVTANVDLGYLSYPKNFTAAQTPAMNTTGTSQSVPIATSTATTTGS